jgi:hypothetical protein
MLLLAAGLVGSNANLFSKESETGVQHVESLLEEALAELKEIRKKSHHRTASSSTVKFVPVQPTACSQSPCLTSTAQDRVAADCSRRLWSGKWTIPPESWMRNITAGRAVSHPIGMGDMMWYKQRFKSSATDCQPAEALVLSPGYESKAQHVSVATSQFSLQRLLPGLRNAMWLMIGSSIDHGILHEVCVHWGAGAPKVYDAPPTKLIPKPGMHVVYCTLPPPLNFSMVEVSGHGLTSEAHQRDRKLHTQLLVEFKAMLDVIGYPKGLCCHH